MHTPILEWLSLFKDITPGININFVRCRITAHIFRIQDLKVIIENSY